MALHELILAGDVEGVRAAIEGGADVNARTALARHRFCNPLGLALDCLGQPGDRLRINRLQVVQALCQDERVDFTDKKGFVFHYKNVDKDYHRQATVLHLLSAARFRDGSAEERACARAVLQRAVAAGVSLDHRVGGIWMNGRRLRDPVSPLLLAANRGQLVALRLLLAAGADARRRPEERSIAWYALGAGHLDCVAALLDAGFTPPDLLLDVAEQVHNTDSDLRQLRGLKQLVDRLAASESTDLLATSSALADRNCLHVLAMGILPLIQDAEAWDIWLEMFEQVVAAFGRRSVNVDAQDTYGMTALHELARTCHLISDLISEDDRAGAFLPCLCEAAKSLLKARASKAATDRARKQPWEYLPAQHAAANDSVKLMLELLNPQGVLVPEGVREGGANEEQPPPAKRQRTQLDAILEKCQQAGLLDRAECVKYAFLLRHHPAEWVEADVHDLAALDQAGALGAAAACVQLACRSHGAAGPTPATAQLAGLLERCMAAGVLEVAQASRYRFDFRWGSEEAQAADWADLAELKGLGGLADVAQCVGEAAAAAEP